MKSSNFPKNKNANAVTSIEILWHEGFFKEERMLNAVSENISGKWDHNFPPSEISKALGRAVFLVKKGKRGRFRYIQKTSPIDKRIETIEDQLFSDELKNKFGVAFEKEVQDLHFNFGRSGTCTAFLLRKILEKAIYLVFAKNGISSKLEDPNQNGKLIGLESMVNAAAVEKINNIPILLPRTAKEIKGIKFLGDASAHNPLTNVDMETILPQMPFIIMAYKELAERLI